jgi:uncharacterized protein YcbK (DUF882 family)
MSTALDFKLSPNFTWGEMTRTGNTDLQEVNRKEAEQHLEKAKVLCNTLLEPIRAKFGPLRINSAFRGPAVNAKVGGSKTSQHMLFEAADFVSAKGVDLKSIFDWIRLESKIPFGQLIYEHPGNSLWIHISLGAPYRKSVGEVLDYDGKSYKPVK